MEQKKKTKQVYKNANARPQLKAETFRRLSLCWKAITEEALTTSFGSEFQQLITRLEKQLFNELVA